MIEIKKNLISFLMIVIVLSGCSSMKYLKYDREAELAKNTEFEKQVKIVAPEEPAAETTVESEKANTPIVEKKIAPVVLKKEKKAKKKASTQNISNKPLVREPSVEDSEGFSGLRRPLIDPFYVGEKIVHSVRYFSAEAGRLTLQIKPFSEINGRKAYNFYVGLKTVGLFSSFYSVDDFVETHLDYEDLVPYVFKISAKETGKLLQAQSFFDHSKLKASYWEKKYTEKNGEEEKKKNWDILPFSQNAFSGIYYMRIFKWNIGQEYAFRVADDEKNIVFKGKALAKEKLETDAGDFDAIKIKAEIVSRGALTQSGNIYVWLSDDDRKVILRIEAEIKIGKLVSEIVEYQKGN